MVRSHRPFPWHALPRVAATEGAALRGLRRILPISSRVLAEHARALLGHDVSIELRRRALTTAARVELGSRGPITILDGEHGAMALEVEAELALAAVGALAGGRSLPRVARGRQVDPLVAGALGGVLQHLARACDAQLSIVTVDATLEDVRRSIGVAEAVALDVAVRLGALRGMVRLVVSVPEIASIPLHASATPHSLDGAKRLLLALGALPRTLHFVVGAGHMPLRSLGALEVGDVVVVDHRCSALAPSRGQHGIAVDRSIASPFAVRLGASRVELAAEPMPNEEDAMSDDNTAATAEMPALDATSPVAEVIAAMPVTVRVELGSATLAAGEWAALGTGDVVVLDARVGDLVTLRVSGRVVGRGELVEVDGGIGVRLTERA